MATIQELRVLCPGPVLVNTESRLIKLAQPFILLIITSTRSPRELPTHTSCLSDAESVTLPSETTALWFEAMPTALLPCEGCSEETFAGATPVVEVFTSPFSQSVVNFLSWAFCQC